MKRTRRRAAFVVVAVLALVCVSPGRATARCGDDPGDPDAVTATRAAVVAQCNCTASTLSDHGNYVRCASQVVRAAVAANRLPRPCMSAVMKCARDSIIGRAAVACCRTNSRGVTTSRIERDAAHCVARRGGTACVSPAWNVCDALLRPADEYAYPDPKSHTGHLPVGRRLAGIGARAVHDDGGHGGLRGSAAVSVCGPTPVGASRGPRRQQDCRPWAGVSLCGHPAGGRSVLDVVGISGTARVDRRPLGAGIGGPK